MSRHGWHFNDYMAAAPTRDCYSQSYLGTESKDRHLCVCVKVCLRVCVCVLEAFFLLNLVFMWAESLQQFCVILWFSIKWQKVSRTSELDQTDIIVWRCKNKKKAYLPLSKKTLSDIGFSNMNCSHKFPFNTPCPSLFLSLCIHVDDASLSELNMIHQCHEEVSQDTYFFKHSNNWLFYCEVPDENCKPGMLSKTAGTQRGLTLFTFIVTIKNRMKRISLHYSTKDEEEEGELCRQSIFLSVSHLFDSCRMNRISIHNRTLLNLL